MNLFSNGRIEWEVWDLDPSGSRNNRVVDIENRKRWCMKLPILSRSDVNKLIAEWGSEVSQEIRIAAADASIVLVVRYYDGPAHVVEGPYRIVEE